jgi:hypothetical protein
LSPEAQRWAFTAELRRQRWTGKQIAAETDVSPATFSRVPRRLGLNKLSALEPAEPIRRYERDNRANSSTSISRSSAVLARWCTALSGRQSGVVNRHLGIGWKYVHVCIDDASRVPRCRSRPISTKKARSPSRKLQFPYYAKLVIRNERVVTDNRPCHRPTTFQAAHPSREIS